MIFMTDDIAIRVRGLGKKYVIGGAQEKYLTLRDAIVNSLEKYQKYAWISFTGAPRQLR